MPCGRFGFLVRLIDLMAVVQNGTGKSNLPHACALADGDKNLIENQEGDK